MAVISGRPLRAGPLDGLGDLAGLQAARADVHAARSVGHEDPYLLEVRIEAQLGGHHRMASAVAERRALVAAVTGLRLETGECSGRPPWVACPGCRLESIASR